MARAVAAGPMKLTLAVSVEVTDEKAKARAEKVLRRCIRQSRRLVGVAVVDARIVGESGTKQCS